MISPLVVLLIVYAVATLAVVLITVSRYVQETGALDWLSFFYALREVLVVAIELLWWVVILRAWGLIEVEWAAKPLTLSAAEDQLTYLAVLAFALLIALIYWDGHVATATGLALISVLTFSAYMDFGVLGALIVLGIIITVLTIWAAHSELKTRLETRAGRPRRKRKEKEAAAAPVPVTVG
jgi:hypothetical protein